MDIAVPVAVEVTKKEDESKAKENTENYGKGSLPI